MEMMTAQPQNGQLTSKQIPQLPNKQDQKKAFSPLVSIFGISITTVVMFFGGYFYLQYLQNTDIEQTENTQAEEQAKEEANLKQLEENTKNDQSRKLDLANLEKGLENFNEKNKRYPEKLEELTPDYLTVIPLDPISKIPYGYEPSKDLKNFALSAQLSDRSVYSIKSDD